MHHNPQKQEQLSIKESPADPAILNREGAQPSDNESRSSDNESMSPDEDLILKITLLTSVESPDWNEIISLLRQQSDVVNGISHTVNHEKGLIQRELRRQHSSRCELYDFAQQVVNLYCGASEIISVTEVEEGLKETLLSTLKEQAIENLNHILSLSESQKSNADTTKKCRKFLVQCNSELVGLLKSTVLSDLTEKNQRRSKNS